MDATPLGADAGPATESENPLAAAPPPDIELAAAADEAGAFALTLKDMFGKTETVQVSVETKVFEVKELLRAAKASEAEAALASAREALARLEGEMAQASEDKARVAALEAERLAAAGEVARLEAQAAETGSVEYVDAMALLYNQDTLDDDSTVGSHGLTEGTTVTLSMAQAPESGRAARQEWCEREAEERRAPLRKAKRPSDGRL